jgi:phage gp37-like protein
MLAQIERAIAALVRATSDAGMLGYAFGTVASYDEAATAMATGTLAFPALWVAYDGEAAPERLDAGVYRRRPSFVVAVAGEQWLNLAFVRGKAETGLPGAYQLADDIWTLLAERDLGLECTGLRPGEIRPERDETGLTVCHIEFSTEFTATTPAPFDDLGDYLHHHIDWDIEPHGNVTPPLPTAEADVRDDITLPGPP